MKRVTVFALLFLLLLGLMSACSKEKAQPINAIVDKSTDSIDGNDVFQKSCISCHSSGNLTGGQIKLDADKIHNDFKTEGDLSKFVQANMPKSSPGSLSKDEYDAVVKYLWDQK